ncbi:MAG: allophanate hydrolase [Deltaproteobacteria bacterium]|nr:allophanate hydrolase [Deltaproteobacteria bacterium]
MEQSLEFGALRAAYAAGLRPAALVDEVLARIAARGDDGVWIERFERAAIEPYLAALASRDPAAAPLWGVPFAIKDNIDLAGVPTTAACPRFAYRPSADAPAVARAIAAGAIPIGKTNLDQFATGLVGVRSPYGVARNPFDATMIPGGSSSGSAVAVAAGLVGFAFGTDTAGSGRVPAAFNNIVGLKPSCGLISTSGVVPACRSLDCVSVFALTVADAAAVLAVVAGFDAAIAALRAAGHAIVEVDIEPFLAAGRLLYEGPWVAERYAAIRAFFDAHADALHPVTRGVIGGGAAPSAADAFGSIYRLRELRRATESTWARVDALLLPTAATAYRIDAVAAEPLRLNAQLGVYTNFVNLLDLCGVAVPAGLQPNGFPFGVTLLAPAFHESLLLPLAAALHAAAGVPLGATGHPLPAGALPEAEVAAEVELAVCGAHLSGLPLNHQLTERGARLLVATRTAPEYRLVALPDGRPGLDRVGAGGAAIEVEVWSVPLAQFGSFVAAIPPPLGIGTVRLADGRGVKGFLCEAIAAAAAPDISAHGGWRAYLATRQGS